MKTMKMLILMALSILFFGGCIVDNPMESMTDADAKIEVTDADGKTYTFDPVSYANQLEQQRFDDCMAFKREKNTEKWNQVARLEGDSLENYLANEQWKDALVSINGKEQCEPGTNMFEAYKAYALATGKVYEVALGEAGKTLRFGLGVWGATDIAGSIFDAVSGHAISSAGGDIEIVDSMNEEKQVILQNSDGSSTANPVLDKSKAEDNSRTE